MAYFEFKQFQPKFSSETMPRIKRWIIGFEISISISNFMWKNVVIWKISFNKRLVENEQVENDLWTFVHRYKFAVRVLVTFNHLKHFSI